MRAGQCLAMWVLCGLAALAGDAAKVTVVDNGSFGIMVNGHRIATETFKMEQRAGANVVTSQLKMEDPNVKAMQTAEMELTPEGGLKRYLWRETSPGKSQIEIQPDDNAFLVMRVVGDDGAAGKDSTHPLAPTTPILDDNFFSQMQLLAWRYIAASCSPAATGYQCRYQEQKMPILNPHQQQSMVTSISYVGLQKMSYKGAQQEFRAFKFMTENGDWLFWVDEQNRLVRVLISAEATEVLRD